MATELNLLNRKELAAKLGLKEDQVRYLTVKGKIPVIRLGHSFVRYNFENVVAAILKAETPAVKQPK